jgi:hypothetical protein
MRYVALLSLGLLWGCGKTPAERVERARDAVYNKRPQQALKEYRLALDGVEGDDSREAHRLQSRALLGAADVYYLELRDVRQAVPLYRELWSRPPSLPRRWLRTWHWRRSSGSTTTT